MIVVQRVDRIEIFRNAQGDVVINQYDPSMNEEAVVWFPAQYAEDVIEGIRAALEVEVATSESK